MSVRPETGRPSPPGDYWIELNGEKIPFSLKAGEHLKFQRSD